MFPSLWLNRFISSYNEKDQINSADTSQHVFDEPFVAGYVYKTEAHAFGRFPVREPKVNGYPTLLFFFETVGIDAR